MNKILAAAVIIAITFSSATYSSTKQTEQPKAKKTATEKSVTKGTLLFFLNPNGYPCQQQDKILKANMSKISSKADISYIATTDPMSRFSFNRYGVRRLPSLILLDANGEVSKQFPPGIRSAEEISSALGCLDKSC